MIGSEILIHLPFWGVLTDCPIRCDIYDGQSANKC